MTIVLPGAGVARLHAVPVKQRVPIPRAQNQSTIDVTPPKRTFDWTAPLILVGVAIAMLLLAGPMLWGRAFWLDECLTYLIASDPSLDHALGALAGGVDTNPPGVHVLLRIVGGVFGHTPGVYRVVMTVCTLLAAWGVHAIVARRAGRRREATFALLAFLSMPLVLHHATDARFYAPMLALCAGVALLLDVRSTRTSAFTALLLGLLSAGLVLTHYFGAIVLGCLAIGAFATSRERWSQRVAQLFPLSAGAATLVALRPLLAAQREALASAGGTWMSVGLLERVTSATQQLFPILPAVPLLVAVALVVLRGNARSALATLGPLGGLLFMPVAVLAFDLFVQPVFVARYLLPIALPIAVIGGSAIALLSPKLRISITVLLVASFVTTMLQKRVALSTQLDARSTTALLRAIDAHPSLPVLSDWRGYALPLALARHDRTVWFHPRAPFDAHPSLLGSIPFEALMARINERFYGVPQHLPAQDALPAQFLFITEFPESARSAFSGRDVREITPVVFVVGPATATQRGGTATTPVAPR